jgi:hypothetical protein
MVRLNIIFVAVRLTKEKQTFPMTKELFTQYVAPWYEQSLMQFYDTMEVREITFMERDILKIEYLEKNSNEIHQLRYADPDDFHENPIRIGSEQYYVMGSLMMVDSD